LGNKRPKIIVYLCTEQSKTTTMALDKIKIKKNAESIIGLMKTGYQYSLSKLEEITRIGTTELCLALLVLIQENRVEQYQGEDGIRYAIR